MNRVKQKRQGKKNGIEQKIKKLNCTETYEIEKKKTILVRANRIALNKKKKKKEQNNNE